MSMRRCPIYALVVCATPILNARSQTAGDSTAVRATALDYIEGWYAGDANRMERALHPELAKRNVTTDAAGRSTLKAIGAMSLVQSTRKGGGASIVTAERRADVRILDMHGSAASVKVRAATWVDYMHIAKFNGRWVIVNVLWENDRPASPPEHQ